MRKERKKKKKHMRSEGNQRRNCTGDLNGRGCMDRLKGDEECNGGMKATKVMCCWGCTRWFLWLVV